MPTMTYKPIATTTLSSNAVSYTFSSIPSTYTDLVLEISNAKSTVDGNGFTFGVNGDTNTNYSGNGISGYGTGASAFRYNTTFGSTWVGGWLAGMSTTGTSQATINFQNYSNTSTYKTVLARFGSANKSSEASVWLWRSTSAINQITIYSQTTANLASGTILTLYGIL